MPPKELKKGQDNIPQAAKQLSAGQTPNVLLVFPSALTPKQRAAVHAVGEAHGLYHESHGEGTQRHIRLGKQGGEQVDVSSKDNNGAGMTDDQLCQLIKDHLLLDASSAFVQQPSGSAKDTVRTHGKPNGNHKGATASEVGLPDLSAWVNKMIECVELERQAEVQQATEATAMCSPETAQARGQALLNLRVHELEGGLLGRTLITLVSNKGYSGSGPAPELPPHKFGGHDVVALRPHKAAQEGPPLCSGVVYRVRDNALIIAVDEAPEEGLDQPLRLEKLANEVTYKRLKATLGSMSRIASGGTFSGSQSCPGKVLVDVAFGSHTPRFVDNLPHWKPVNVRLDDSQRAAISKALTAKDVALIHGPPGQFWHSEHDIDCLRDKIASCAAQSSFQVTVQRHAQQNEAIMGMFLDYNRKCTGKTTAVVEFIVQELSRGSRVLAVAASNIAVDNLTERVVLAAPKAKVLRMGHPARLLPQVLDCCLEAHVMKSDNSALAKDCRKEIKSLNQQLMKLGPRDRAERRAIRGDLKRLAGEERKRQEAAIVEVIKSAKVVASTLTGLLHHHLEGQVFDVVVIDEAAQALEPACWEALLRAPRAVLAGDHFQLPPTVVSKEAESRGLGVTLFERLHRLHGHACSSMLTMQYRMNSNIMTWSSEALYEGRLEAHASVADHTLKGLLESGGSSAKGSKAKATTPMSVPAVDIPVLLLIDTAGCGFDEQQEEEGESKRNEGEAKAVMAHIKRLITAGLKPGDIGIITPYNAQVALLREMRPEKLQGVEISSVDGFQGREKEAIVISMVRSNPKGEVGFLADQRRMNVAVTRARRHVALVADSETVSKDPFLAGLLQHFDAHGEYCSAQELVDEAMAAS